MTYVDASAQKQRPIMIHRAIFGSMERFFGILVENYAGAFPLWLAPVQVRLLPVNDAVAPYVQEVGAGSWCCLADCADYFMWASCPVVFQARPQLCGVVFHRWKVSVPIEGLCMRLLLQPGPAGYMPASALIALTRLVW